MSVARVDQFIGGKRTSESHAGRAAGKTHVVTNPATGEAVAHAELESMRSAEAAVQAASEAFPAWSNTPVGDRCQFLFRYKQSLEKHFEELAAMIAREHGKTMAEGRGDVRRGIDCVEFARGPATDDGPNVAADRGEHELLQDGG